MTLQGLRVGMRRFQVQVHVPKKSYLHKKKKKIPSKFHQI